MNSNGDIGEPIVDTQWVKDWLGTVSDKRGKIARMINSGILIQLRRGLYATKRELHPYFLASSIYGPSYISFDTALSYHGLIPEAVYEITSATVKRSREYENAFGRYRYRNIPARVYPIGVARITDGDIPFLIATPTKAICDRIALEPRMRSMSDVKRWGALMRLNHIPEFEMTVLEACARYYKRPAVRWLQRTIEKYGGLVQ